MNFVTESEEPRKIKAFGHFSQGFKSHLPHETKRLRSEILSLFRFRTEAVLESKIQGLRFAPVGAKQTSTGRLAPHLPLRIMPYLSHYLLFSCVQTECSIRSKIV